MDVNETDFRKIFQAAPDGMSVSSLQGGLFREINDSFSEMFGYRREDVIGRASYELNFWHNFSEREQLVEKLAKAVAIDNFEATIVSRDGRRVSVMVSVRVMTLGAEDCLIISYKNVTAHAQVVNALRDSEKKFKDIFDTTPDAIIISDQNGRIYDVNSVFEVMTGYPRAEIIGQSTVEIGLWEDVKKREEFLVELDTHGRVQNFEMRIRTRHGDLGYYLVSAKQIIIEGETRILSIARDITYIKDAEQCLREEEHRFRELSLERQVILEAIPDALILWSDQHEVVWANRNARQYLKTSHDQAVGKSCRELCQTAEYDQEKCIVHLGFARAAFVELLEKTTNGETWAIKAFPILTKNGAVVNVLTLASDITERMRLREEANRSARLAALGELAAGVAHEINNPTGLILMNTSLVKDVMADLKPLLDEHVLDAGAVQLGGLAYQRAIGELPGILTETIESGHRIKQIVEDLKDFSRLAPQDTFAPVDLNNVVSNTLRIMRLAIDKATDSFAVEYAADLPKVLGNARQLEQVVVNLLSNACHALREQSESLVVAVSSLAESQEVCLRVWDEGCGIEEEIIPHITDPFFTTKRESGGTGLGLSVSSRIIEDHDGRIYFESTPGYGTSVTVLLPAMTTK